MSDQVGGGMAVLLAAIRTQQDRVSALMARTVAEIPGPRKPGSSPTPTPPKPRNPDGGPA